MRRKLTMAILLLGILAAVGIVGGSYPKGTEQPLFSDYFDDEDFNSSMWDNSSMYGQTDVDFSYVFEVGGYQNYYSAPAYDPSFCGIVNDCYLPKYALVEGLFYTIEIHNLTWKGSCSEGYLSISNNTLCDNIVSESASMGNLHLLGSGPDFVPCDSSWDERNYDLINITVNLTRIDTNLNINVTIERNDSYKSWNNSEMNWFSTSKNEDLQMMFITRHTGCSRYTNITYDAFSISSVNETFFHIIDDGINTTALNMDAYLWAKTDGVIQECNFTALTPSGEYVLKEENSSWSDGIYFNSTAISLNETGLYTYFVNCSAVDDYVLTDYFVVGDSVGPALSLDNPIHGTTLSSSPTLSFYAEDDFFLKACEYTTDSWTTSSTISNCTNFGSGALYVNQRLSLSDGSYELILNVTDLAGNINSSSVNFTVSTPLSPSGGGGGGAAIILGGNATSIIDFDGRSSYFFTLLLGAPAEEVALIRVTNLGTQEIRGKMGISGESSKYITAELCDLDVENCSSDFNLAEKESGILKLSLNVDYPLPKDLVDGVLQVEDEITGEVNEFVVGVGYPPMWKLVRYVTGLSFSERQSAQIVGSMSIILFAFFVIFLKTVV